MRFWRLAFGHEFARSRRMPSPEDRRILALSPLLHAVIYFAFGSVRYCRTTRRSISATAAEALVSCCRGELGATHAPRALSLLPVESSETLSATLPGYF